MILEGMAADKVSLSVELFEPLADRLSPVAPIPT